MCQQVSVRFCAVGFAISFSEELNSTQGGQFNKEQDLVIFMELHSSKEKGDRRRTSDHAQTRDLRAIAEFQPRKPWRTVEICCPILLLCTSYRCAAIQRHLRPAPSGWYCVQCDGSRLQHVVSVRESEMESYLHLSVCSVSACELV